MVRWLIAGVLFVGATVLAETSQDRQGVEFQSADIQSMQADDFQNSGFLAVDEGERLLALPNGAAEKACNDCHESFDGIAVSFPKHNVRLNRIVSLSSQVMACREDHQKADPVDYESEPIQSITAFIAAQSRGMAFEPVPHALDAAVQRGRDYYYQRKGQLNLACSHCHENNAGRLLRGDLISQGVSTGYPIYRLEWQTIGSIHRRFRSCDIGVRAEPAIIGGQVYTDLELYLRTRAGDLPVTAPAVRR